MQRAPRLKVIGKHGVGCNTIDLDAARELGITVFNTPTANTNSVAELIVGLILDIARNNRFPMLKAGSASLKPLRRQACAALSLREKRSALSALGTLRKG